MKKIFKIISSLLFLLIVIFFSSRYFILNKLDHKDIENKLKTLTQLYLKNTKTNVGSFTFNVSTSILIHLDSFNILSIKNDENLLNAENISLKVPLGALFNSKAKIIIEADKIQYSDNKEDLLSHLKSPTKEIAVKNFFPRFLSKARNSFRIKSVLYGDFNLGRLSLKNTKYSGSTAFEIKKNLDDMGVLRLVGDFSLSDLVETGELNLKSTFKWGNISKIKEATPLKGRVLTKRINDILMFDINLESEDFLNVNTMVSFDEYNIYFNNIIGDVSSKVISHRVLEKIKPFSINFTGSSVLNKKTFELNPLLDLKSKESVNNGDFSHSYTGTLVDEKLKLLVSSSLGADLVETKVFATGNFTDLLASEHLVRDLKLDVKSRDFPLIELKRFKDFDVKSLNTNYSVLFDFEKISSMKQVFQLSGKIKFENSLFELQRFNLQSAKKNVVDGTLFFNTQADTMNYDFELSELDSEFISELIKNNGLEVSGIFSGTIKGEKLSGENLKTLYVLEGKSGALKNLSDFIKLEDLSSELKFDMYETLKLNLEVSNNSLKFNLFDLEDKKEQKFLSLLGEVSLKNFESKLNGVAKSRNIETPFTAIGTGVNLTFKRLINE